LSDGHVEFPFSDARAFVGACIERRSYAAVKQSQALLRFRALARSADGENRTTAQPRFVGECASSDRFFNRHRTKIAHCPHQRALVRSRTIARKIVRTRKKTLTKIFAIFTFEDLGKEVTRYGNEESR
jgi:hypothetical protein